MTFFFHSFFRRALLKMTLFIFLFGVVSVSSCFASTFEPSPWTTKKPYTEKIGNKLGFGLLNFGTGWTALFFEPTFMNGFWKGLGRGVLFTITNTAGGAVHAVTFPIPIDIPLPNGGVRFYNKADK